MVADDIPWDEKTNWQKVKKVYYYVFEENTLLSWVVSIILAFVIVKFIFYPFLSLVLGTGLPLVAVISPSMEHEHMDFDSWWDVNGEWYEARGLTKEQFNDFTMHDGFYKGDVIVLKGKDNVEVGDIVVYTNTYSGQISNYPIIHRVTFINETANSFEVKGDNNDMPDQWPIVEEEVVGTAYLRIPYIGWLKIWFAQLIGG